MENKDDRKCGNCRRCSINEDHEKNLYCWYKDKMVMSITPACDSNDDFLEVNPKTVGAGRVKKGGAQCKQPVQ